jgi:hypothetical protein
MGSLFRRNASVERFEAFSVLAAGCRHLAQTCVTSGARDMLRNLADDLERQANETDGDSMEALVEASVAACAVPAACA